MGLGDLAVLRFLGPRPPPQHLHRRGPYLRNEVVQQG